MAFERGRGRLDMPGNFADSPRANWLASVSARVTPNAHHSLLSAVSASLCDCFQQPPVTG